ncbi:MAG: hypothetical protein AAGB24_13955 [Bacteroidota bacterium]
MEYKCPKVLEKSPQVMGFSLAKVGVILVSILGFLFTMMNHFFLSLIFPVSAGAFFYVTNKFPGKGELAQFLKYKAGNQCIKCNQQLKCIVRTAFFEIEE